MSMTIDDLAASIAQQIAAFKASMVGKLTTPLPANLTVAAKRQIAAQGGQLLDGQYIDPNWGFVYSPLTDAEKAGKLDPAWSYNLVIGIKTPLYQDR